MTYREDLASASERLARLDAVHAERVLERRRLALEEERAALVAPRPGVPGVVIFGAVIAAFVGLRQLLLHHDRAPAGSGLLLFLALVMVVGVGGEQFWKLHRRTTAVTDIDAQLLELEPEPHVPPATLAEAHERILVREAELAV